MSDLRKAIQALDDLQEARDVGDGDVRDDILDKAAEEVIWAARKLVGMPRVIYQPVVKKEQRCGTCGHWKKLGDNSLPNHGDCRLLVHGDYARNRCIIRLAVANGPIEHGNAGLAEFVTRASFGCVQWEKRRDDHA